jgi:hypothetical protein
VTAKQKGADYELIVDLRVASAMGIHVPQDLLLRAMRLSGKSVRSRTMQPVKFALGAPAGRRRRPISAQGRVVHFV